MLENIFRLIELVESLPVSLQELNLSNNRIDAISLENLIKYFTT
jgi:Leucine-rich repeat (LRR) protein